MDQLIDFFEVVRIVSLPPDWGESFVPAEGVVLGRSDPDASGTVVYGVFLYENQRVRSFTPDQLRPTGRKVSRQHLPPNPVRRSRREQKTNEEKVS